ncbi:MAG TPA: hypothetical protein VLH09_02835 [Bryobacteraceae bacterium]|nr:hypothetical protein [Bryobacteraceae bacterium]
MDILGIERGDDGLVRRVRISWMTSSPWCSSLWIASQASAKCSFPAFTPLSSRAEAWEITSTWLRKR